jgi:hypothetical protein
MRRTEDSSTDVVVDDVVVVVVVSASGVVVVELSSGAVGPGVVDPVHPQSKTASITSHRVPCMRASIPRCEQAETPDPAGFSGGNFGKSGPG